MLNKISIAEILRLIAVDAPVRVCEWLCAGAVTDSRADAEKCFDACVQKLWLKLYH